MTRRRSPLPREILHVTASSVTAGSLRSSSVPSSDSLLVWGDALLVGPVTETQLEPLSRIRARYRKSAGASGLGTLMGREAMPKDVPSFAVRDRLLRRCGEFREVALWFGPTVEEQLSLLQIVAALAQQDLGQTRVSLVSCPLRAMSAWTPAQLPQFFASRAPILKEHLQFGSRVWAHFCAPDPMPLDRFVRRNAVADPVPCAALAFVLREYPSVRSGLSALETMLLQQVPEQQTTARSVVAVMCSEEGGSVGDGILFEMIWRFLNCRQPLLEPAAGALQDADSWLKFCRLPVRLTPAGQRVLAGDADHIAWNGIDRWVGGVHLKGKSVAWRSDAGGKLRPVTQPASARSRG